MSRLEGRLVSCSSDKEELKRQVSESEENRAAEIVEFRRYAEEQLNSNRVLEFGNVNLGSDLRSKTENHREAVLEVSRLKSLNASLSTEVSKHGARLQSHVDDASDRLSRAAVHTRGPIAHNTSIKSECEHAREQLQVANTNLLLMKNEHSQAVHKIQDLTHSNRRALWEWEECRQKAAKLQANLKSTTEKHDKAVNNIFEIHSSSSDLKLAQEYLESQLTTLRSELAKMIADCRHKIEEAKQLNERARFPEKRLRDGKNQEDQLRSELSKRTAEHVQVVNDAKQLNNRIEALQKERQEAQSTADVLRLELSKVHTDHEKAVEDAKQVRIVKTALQTEYEDARNQVRDL